MDKEAALGILSQVMNSLTFSFSGMNDHNNVFHAWNVTQQVFKEAIEADKLKESGNEQPSNTESPAPVN